MARAHAQQNHTFHEVIGLTLLGIGTLVFLSLISYTPRDVPSWFPLATVSSASRNTLNFIGPFGAIIACSIYALLGAASFLLAAVLLGCGGAKLLNPSLQLKRRVPWIAAFIISGACLAELGPFAFIDAHRLNLAGEGGWIGRFVGASIFKAVFSTAGALIVFTVVYTVSLMCITGLQPVAVLKKMLRAPARWITSPPAPAAAVRPGSSRHDRTDEDTLVVEPEELARKQRRRVAGRKTSSESSDAGGDAQETSANSETAARKQDQDFQLKAEEEEPPRPAPKIIDSAALPPPAKPRKEKKEKLATLAPLECENYTLPPMDLLDAVDHSERQAADPQELLATQDTIIDTLAQFGLSVSRGDITRGPTITRYEVYPAKGVRVDRIVALERDIARATRAERINILAPIPGKDTVGIEIANAKKTKVTVRELMESEEFQNSKARIPLALGRDVYGKAIIADLGAMPHCLVAGTTGSGKSVCINSIIASMLYRFSPEDLRMIMIDPKVVEMQVYNTLPHLVIPVVTDPKKVLLALRWVIDEMEKRYKIFAKTGVRNITGFNSRPKPKSQKELDEEREAAAANDLFAASNARAATPEPPPEVAPVASTADILGTGANHLNGEGEAGAEPTEDDGDEVINADSMPKGITVPRDDDPIIPDRMPYIVVIVDELADLMQTAPADVEMAIARITQMARAAGIHMIVATQTPRADVVTGVIKANIPTRIAFQVASKIDSRVILDENGAERLLGQGDMLYLPPGSSKLIRSQGVLVTDEEIRRIVDHAATQSPQAFDLAIHEKIESAGMGEEEELSDEDEELVEKCIEVMRQERKASTSLFQRRLKLGYTRAARIVDILEARGYIGAGEGAKPREILVDPDTL